MAKINENINEEELKEQKEKKRRKKVLIIGGVCFLIIILLLIFFFKKPLTVSFVTNGGSQIDVISVNDDGYINVPKDPKRFGWDFGGWYSDSKLTSKIDDLSKFKFTSSTIIYAKWYLHRYTITYVLNGGTNNVNNPTVYVIKHSEPEDETWEADFIKNGSTFVPLPNDKIMLSNITLLEPTKSGATFDGWYKTPDFVGSKVTSIQTIEPEDLTLYAKWK